VQVPVRLVDSGTSRFKVSCCVWAAGTALASGATLDEAASIAEGLAPSVGTVFVAAGLGDMCREGTRRVHALEGDTIRMVADVESVAASVNAMAAYALRWNPAGSARTCGSLLNVGVGWAHRDTRPIARAIAHALGESAGVAEVIDFRIGPSVGAEIGPGAVSCVMFPA
jgi:fatty acid-binding protein DegV